MFELIFNNYLSSVFNNSDTIHYSITSKLQQAIRRFRTFSCSNFLPEKLGATSDGHANSFVRQLISHELRKFYILTYFLLSLFFIKLMTEYSETCCLCVVLMQHLLISVFISYQFRLIDEA